MKNQRNFTSADLKHPLLSIPDLDHVTTLSWLPSVPEVTLHFFV